MSEPFPQSVPGHNDPHGAGPSGGTGLLEATELQEQAQPGDHERYAHFVRKNKIMSSALSGNPVIALCGKVWVPGRDPNKFPVCPACKAIYDGLQPGGDDGPAGKK